MVAWGGMVATGGMHGCWGVCMVAPGGQHVWLLREVGGVHGCSWGACVVALGCVWLLPGACVVALGVGCAWLLWGACVVALRGHAWLLLGGMRCCSQVVCMVAAREACVVAAGGACMVEWDTMRYGDTINERAVCILLECILVHE